MNKVTFDLLSLPPAKYEATADKMSDQEMMQIIDSLDAIAEHATRLSRYLNVRVMKGGHAQARRNSNRAVRTVRRTLGFNLTHDLNY